MGGGVSRIAVLFGASGGKPGRNVYAENQHLLVWKPAFDTMCMGREEIGKLYDVFARIDHDHSGELSVGEIMAFFSLERTPFNKRVFTIFVSFARTAYIHTRFSLPG